MTPVPSEVYIWNDLFWKILFQELQEWLTAEGFMQSNVCPPCFFWKICEDDFVVKLLNYVDDMLHFRTSKTSLMSFKDSLFAWLDINFLGQAHWYLSTQINQENDVIIIIDQSRYCHCSVVKHFLKAGETKRVQCEHVAPPHNNFVITSQDCTPSLEASLIRKQQEYNIDYASCIGASIYLSYTRANITFTVNKLAKYMKLPGEHHMQALLHLLRYLWASVHLGIKHYYIGMFIVWQIVREQGQFKKIIGYHLLFFME